jgi:chromosomal replication initiation ATPase DnaA
VTFRQLTLPIPARHSYVEASFLNAGSNEAARTWLGRTEVWPERRLALWGGEDCGKTHLLRIWADRNAADLVDGLALSGFPPVGSATPAGLPSLVPPRAISAAGVAIDDADRADEAALLHLLNSARDLGCPVLLAARLPPAHWTIGLRDLASRLRALTTVEVGAPDDDLLRRLLLHWLAERQLVADETLHDRLLVRLPRSPEVLRAAVARLDVEALTSRKRTVTPAMVRDAVAAAAESAATDGVSDST